MDSVVRKYLERETSKLRPRGPRKFPPGCQTSAGKGWEAGKSLVLSKDRRGVGVTGME